ncbi:MAG: hypothetical protein BWK80_30010 [Desulfobacteraceae bacterium IS3]|nr:MAG: hypothetical protein BWK80_30010 [Desulfobacteraceae bacterium IS3]
MILFTCLPDTRRGGRSREKAQICRSEPKESGKSFLLGFLILYSSNFSYFFNITDTDIHHQIYSFTFNLI